MNELKDIIDIIGNPTCTNIVYVMCTVILSGNLNFPMYKTLSDVALKVLLYESILQISINFFSRPMSK